MSSSHGQFSASSLLPVLTCEFVLVMLWLESGRCAAGCCALLSAKGIVLSARVVLPKCRRFLSALAESQLPLSGCLRTDLVPDLVPFGHYAIWPID